MENKAAKTVSVLFHPLLIPTYLFLILFYSDSYFALVFTTKGKWMLLAFISLITLLLPGSIMLFLYQKKIIPNLEMRSAGERNMPYVIVGTFYYLNYYFTKNINLPTVISSMLLGGTLAVLLLTIINFYWKISAHLLGMGSLFGALCGLSNIAGIDFSLYILISLLVSGIVGWARLELEAHTPSQVYAGFALGTAVMWLSIVFL